MAIWLDFAVLPTLLIVTSPLPFPPPPLWALFSNGMICTKMDRLIKCSICCLATLVLGYLIETIDFIMGHLL